MEGEGTFGGRDMTGDFDIVGLGASTLDLLMVVDEFPHDEGVIEAHDFLIQGGGPVATALAAASRLGARTAMLDALGDDWRSRIIVEEFERFGVATNYLHVCPRQTPSTSTILVRKRDGARAIVFRPGGASTLIGADEQIDLLRRAKILHITGRHIEACRALGAEAQRIGVKISFDGGAGRFSDVYRDLLARVDYCIVALDFARAWFHRDLDIEAAARRISAQGVELAVVTNGAEGSFIVAGGDAFHQPAFPVDVVDTTGCGDVYHGAFLFGLARGFALRETARIASAVAAMKARALGGRGFLPSLQETKEFLARRVAAAR